MYDYICEHCGRVYDAAEYGVMDSCPSDDCPSHDTTFQGHHTMRTIEIRTADMEAFTNHYETHTQAVHNALNYLTMWALTGYGYLDLFVMRDGEMTACYYRNQKAHDDGERPGFVIGAIFHEPEDDAPARYSFHS